MALGAQPITMRQVIVMWTPSHTYEPGDRMLADLPPRVTKLPLHLGWWVHGAGYCPTRKIRDHAVLRHTETVEAVCVVKAPPHQPAKEEAPATANRDEGF